MKSFEINFKLSGQDFSKDQYIYVQSWSDLIAIGHNCVNELNLAIFSFNCDKFISLPFSFIWNSFFFVCTICYLTEIDYYDTYSNFIEVINKKSANF